MIESNESIPPAMRRICEEDKHMWRWQPKALDYRCLVCGIRVLLVENVLPKKKEIIEEHMPVSPKERLKEIQVLGCVPHGEWKGIVDSLSWFRWRVNKLEETIWKLNIKNHLGVAARLEYKEKFKELLCELEVGKE